MPSCIQSHQIGTCLGARASRCLHCPGCESAVAVHGLRDVLRGQAFGGELDAAWNLNSIPGLMRTNADSYQGASQNGLLRAKSFSAAALSASSTSRRAVSQPIANQARGSSPTALR